LRKIATPSSPLTGLGREHEILWGAQAAMAGMVVSFATMAGYHLRNVSRRGTDLLLQVRCAGLNDKLGSSFGQLFQAVDPASELTMAA
jgi:hypothetical protein